MAKPGSTSSSLTGSAGVYYVAARLNAMNIQCAPTFGNVPHLDMLVSSHKGSALISLSVKSTNWGMRTRGRGIDKAPHHYEWDIGWTSARVSNEKLFFALVDLKEFKELPDVFIVPSKVIAKYFEKGPEGWPRARYHELIENLAPYKNNWDSILDLLKELDDVVPPELLAD